MTAPAADPWFGHPLFDPYPRGIPMSYSAPEPPRPATPQPADAPWMATPPPKRKRRIWPWILFGAIAALLFCGGMLTALGNSMKAEPIGSSVVTPEPIAAPGTDKPAPAAKPKQWRLQASDVEMRVKIQDKQCFGSAGCLLEFRIDAGVTDTVRAKLAEAGDGYEITYEVRGFTDGAQIATLEVDADGSFRQDEFQSGQTSSSSKKLTAKVTDVRKL